MTGYPHCFPSRRLPVDLPTPRGNLGAVDQVDLSIGAGRTLGIVGESGCGKTMLSRAILQLLPRKAKLSGRVMFDGQDLAAALDRERLRKLRGRSLAVVFQDPMTSLNPVLTIGTQLIETLQEHLELATPWRLRCAASNCLRRSASRRLSSGWHNIRTSFPAACGSGWRLRLRCPASPSC